MACILTVRVTKRELDNIVGKVDSAPFNSLEKHEAGNLLKSVKSLNGQAGLYEVELVLESDAREWLKEEGLL